MDFNYPPRPGQTRHEWAANVMFDINQQQAQQMLDNAEAAGREGPSRDKTEAKRATAAAEPHRPFNWFGLALIGIGILESLQRSADNQRRMTFHEGHWWYLDPNGYWYPHTTATNPAIPPRVARIGHPFLPDDFRGWDMRGGFTNTAERWGGPLPGSPFNKC